MKTFKEVKQAYNIEFGISMALYAIALIGVIFIIKYNPNIAFWLKITLATLPSLPLGASIYVFFKYMNNCDEFLQATMGRIFIISTGITMFLCTFWGLLEMLANAPHIPLFYVYVTFWPIFGFVSGFGRFFSDKLDMGSCK